MTLRDHFHSFLDSVRQEGRYRIFTDLERHADRPPYATWGGGGIAREVVVWCSNDYLGMGRHPAVVNAMLETALRTGAGAGGTRNISGNSHAVVMLRQSLPTCTTRKPHSPSLSATSPMRPGSARSVDCYQIASFYRMRRITLR